jgi:very-short-patch-repair endonuclease
MQHGVVSRKQLRELGVSDSAIEKAVLGGRLHLAFRGAFGVGLLPSGELARMMAAVLSCGEDAVVSHLTAAHLLGLRDRAPASVELTAGGKAGRDIAGIRRHYVPLPRGGEKGHCRSIPCTSPSRTIVDLAGILGERSLRRIVERAAVLRLLDAQAIARLLAARRRRGAPTLRAILQPWGATDSKPPTTSRASATRVATLAPHVRSELEARLLTLIGESDLPDPICNQRIDSHEGSAHIEVDFLWPRHRLVVETDGRSFHDDPLAFERDRKRDRDLQLNGYRVVRFTHRHIEEEPDAVISAIRRLLVATTSARPHGGHRDSGSVG